MSFSFFYASVFPPGLIFSLPEEATLVFLLTWGFEGQICPVCYIKMAVLHFWKTFLSGYGILGLQLFSFWAWKIETHSLQDTIVSVDRLDSSLIAASVGISVFSSSLSFEYLLSTSGCQQYYRDRPTFGFPHTPPGLTNRELHESATWCLLSLFKLADYHFFKYIICTTPFLFFWDQLNMR